MTYKAVVLSWLRFAVWDVGKRDYVRAGDTWTVALLEFVKARQVKGFTFVILEG